jgi:mannose-6-phosphate isomerase-like protein (cupin superfamily)
MESARLGSEPDAVAPDGSEVRLLVRGSAGSMAHFTLGAGETSVAVAHRTLEELWYITGGRGEMWRFSEATQEADTTHLHPDTAIAIPPRTHFQFRATGAGPLEAVAVTMPPWPGIGDMSGTGEVYFVAGNPDWSATVETGMVAGPAAE